MLQVAARRFANFANKIAALSPLQSAPDISTRWYWIVSLVLIAATGWVWLAPFEYYYGWQADDWMGFRKAMRTERRPIDAFIIRGNLLQLYFYLYTFLPLRLNLSLPSMEFPIYGPDTGKFRFLAMYTVYFHLVFLLTWAWFAKKICRYNVVALLSLWFIICSPGLALWMPQTETRYIGLPFVLVGVAILIDQLRSTDRPRARWFFLSGFLMTVGQSLHYTSLYLIVPVLATLGPLSLITALVAGDDGERRIIKPPTPRETLGKLDGTIDGLRRLLGYIAGVWTHGAFTLGVAWIAFIVGFVSIPLLFEYVSTKALSTDWRIDGPFATFLYWAFRSHELPPGAFVSVLKFALEYVDYAVLMMGWPLLLAGISGALLAAIIKDWRISGTRWIDVAILITLCVGMVVITVSYSYPFFRKTIPLQPFLFMFAAAAIVQLAWLVTGRLLPQRGPMTTMAHFGLVAALVAWCSLVPIRQSAAVHTAHFDMGRLIAKAHADLKPGAKIIWIMPRLAYYGFEEWIEQSGADDLVLTEFPFDFFKHEPASYLALTSVKPIASAKRVWSTDALHTEHTTWIGFDLRGEPVMNEARLYRAADLKAYFTALKPLMVESITASSSLDQRFGPGNIIDLDGAGHGRTHWQAAATEAAHWIELKFAGSVNLDRINVLSQLFHPQPLRIDEAEIAIAGPKEVLLRSVWRGKGHAGKPLVEATWPMQEVSRLRIYVHRSQRRPFGSHFHAIIEEVSVPGYRLQFDTREDDKEVTSIKSASIYDPNPVYDYSRYGNIVWHIDQANQLRVAVSVENPHSLSGGEIVYMNGTPLPTRADLYTKELIAILPSHFNTSNSMVALCNASFQVGRRGLGMVTPTFRTDPERKGDCRWVPTIVRTSF